MTALDDLEQRLNDRTAVIGVVGLGYVGLPLALRFARVGYPVLGFDSDPAKIETLAAGRSYIRHIPDAAIAELGDRLDATTEHARAAEVDAIVLCLPTPLDIHRQPDLHFVTETLEALRPHLRAGQVVSLESTTWPGTTEEVVVPIVERAGLVPGTDCAVVYSPEREDPGNPDFDVARIPKIVAGITERCRAIGRSLYAQAVNELVDVRDTRTGEMVKLLENIHRAVNIGLVNEMKLVADRMGIDIHEVIEAAATKPFGFVPYQPGPGLGGHCIPIDPFYLTWKAREYGIDTRFIELAGEINHFMPRWVVGKIGEALNRHRKAVNGSRILVLGIAYKKNIGDPRESPAVEIIQLLSDRGAKLAYSDPHVPVFPQMRRYDFDLRSIDIDPETLQSYDCVVVATDHDDFDWAMIREHAPLIVDSRGVYREADDRIVKA